MNGVYFVVRHKIKKNKVFQLYNCTLLTYFHIGIFYMSIWRIYFLNHDYEILIILIKKLMTTISKNAFECYEFD